MPEIISNLLVIIMLIAISLITKNRSLAVWLCFNGIIGILPIQHGILYIMIVGLSTIFMLIGVILEQYRRW